MRFYLFPLIFCISWLEFCFSLITSNPLFLGFDYGTSGVRCCLIKLDNTIVHEYSLLWKDMSTFHTLPHQDPTCWLEALYTCMDKIPYDSRRNIARISISGTSASALLYDTSLKQVTRGPCMYDYSVLSGLNEEYGKKALESISKSCPPGSSTNAPTSTLAKLLMWHYKEPITKNEVLLHQADYIVKELVQKKNDVIETYCTDWNNCLKVGYDVYKLQYPAWLEKCLQDCKVAKSPEELLPKVVEPGRPIGKISSVFVKNGFPAECDIVGGTTDSIAAFLASGANEVGLAVTSLGSTLAIKLLSENPVEDSCRGIYSHRLCGGKWLVGGASNVGCKVLREEGFSNDDLIALSAEIDPNIDSPLQYYPLTKPGERFPIQDPNKQPILEPKPESRVEYLHGILQGIATVEKDAYTALRDLGASQLTEVLTAGGGAQNPTWTAMRQRLLGVETKAATNADAAFGAALLARMYF